jgi:glycogen operon protein
MFLNGEEIATPDERGRRVVDDSFVLLFNANHEDATFQLPPERFGAAWECELRTDRLEPSGGASFAAGEQLGVPARSLVLLRRTA